MWSFERKFVDAAEIDTGPLKERDLPLVWGLLTLAFMAVLGGTFSAGILPLKTVLCFVPIAIILARMVVIDLCYLLLLNIYTLPLTFVGLGYSHYLLGRTWQDAVFGMVVGAAIGLVIDVVLGFIRGQGELGFGDVKLLAALGAWVGLGSLPFALMVAFIANFVIALLLPKKSAIPFGFGLAIGIWALSVLERPFMNLLFKVLG